MTLAFFVDQVFWKEGTVYSCDEAYTIFVAGFREFFDDVVVIGRLAPEPGRKPYVLPPGVRLCSLPYYPGLFSLWKQGASLWRSIRQEIHDQAPRWDVVLVGGPNPVGQYVARLCVEMNRPVVPVVRQNLVPQLLFANHGLKRVVAVAVAAWLEFQFRRLARGRTVLAVGQEMTTQYGRLPSRAHNHLASLITDAQFAVLSSRKLMPESWRLLFVGRLSAEKGLAYLLQAVARLKNQGAPVTLDIVGSGPLEKRLPETIASLGLTNEIRLHGYVPHGEPLFALFARASMLLVPSLSGEGLPQVITEALIVGTPVIASRVGGIPAFLTHEHTALLTDPKDINDLTNAMQRLSADHRLRSHLIEHGRALMSNNTLQANLKRIVAILEREVLYEPVRSQHHAIGGLPRG